MAGIAAFHLGLDRRPGTAPEARQIAGDLDRPVRGDSRCSVSGTRPPASAGCGRGRRVPARGCQRAGRPPPRNRRRRASQSALRNGSAPRRRAGAPSPTAAARAGPRRDPRPTDRGEARLADEIGREPVLRRLARAWSERSGQASPSARRRNITRSRHCVRCLGPRQAVDAERGDRFGEHRCGFGRRWNRQGLFGENERAEPPRPPCPQRRRRSVESDVRARLDHGGKFAVDFRERDRRGRQNARRRARPAISATARNSARARASCGSSTAARPLAMRNSPGLPRALAIRSG